MIRLNAVVVEYPHSRPLDEASAELVETSTVIMGPSGSGKSTLLRVIAGLQAPTSGVVAINGATVARPNSVRSGDSRVSLIHQDYRLVPFLSVEENLMLAAEMRYVEVEEGGVLGALERVGIPSAYAKRKPDSLSGGEQQRVAIARALLCRAAVILADEPTGALDTGNTDRVARVLSEVSLSGDVQVVLATHDDQVASTAAAAYELLDGKLQKTR